MPLFELFHRLTKGKLDSSQDNTPTTSNDPSFVPPENDFVELVWENGQIQTSRARKVQSCNNLPSQILNIRDSDMGNGTSTKMGKYGSVLEPELSEVPIPVPSVELGLNQDDDMVPWLNYPINESLQVQHDFRSEFMPEFSGVTVNEHSENNFLSSGKRRSGDQSSRDDLSSVHSGLNLEQGNMPKASSDGNGESGRPRTSVGELYPQQYPTSFSYFGSMVSGNKNDSMSNSGNHALPGAGDTICPIAGGGFHSIKMQKQVPVPLPPTTNSTVMNFSHFSRPAALVKANLRNVGARAGSGISSLEQIGSKYKGSTTSSSNPSQPMLIEPCSGLRYDSNSSCHPIVVSSKVDANFLEARLGKEHVPDELPVAVNQEDDPKSTKNCSENFGGSTDKKFTDAEKTIEPVVASSSVCSVNSVERPSDDPAQTLKRKNRDTEESEGPSEDFEEESVDAKKVAPARVGGSKRSRAAEVHNLSERRRRDRINEKMRALQELIPNCNKVDKASMLDEAIEYLKTLQLQVQIMSMGSGLYMPSMMLPPGMPHMHVAHMAQFSPMSVGMGMGFAMGMPDMNGGSSGCSVIQVPPMYGPQFPIPPMSGPSAFHGMRGPNFQMFGISGQGLPMPFPRPPLIPISGGPLLKPTMGPNASRLACPVENLDSAPASSSKDLIQNINSQCMQNNGANSSMNLTTSQCQCQTTNECFEQSGLVQSNAQESEFTGNGTLQSAGAEGNDDDESIRTSGCDS